jgi:hypothetical protein
MLSHICRQGCETRFSVQGFPRFDCFYLAPTRPDRGFQMRALSVGWAAETSAAQASTELRLS